MKKTMEATAKLCIAAGLIASAGVGLDLCLRSLSNKPYADVSGGLQDPFKDVFRKSPKVK